jgi:hypothetical protein
MGRLTAHGKIDDFRDNWWSGVYGMAKDKEGMLTILSEKTAPSPPGFLTDEQRSAVVAERKKMASIESGPSELCLRAVEWAKRSPADPRVPEALHLAVKATRYGYRDERTRQRSKSAFETLHKLYPNSKWAKLTEFYYGST